MPSCQLSKPSRHGFQSIYQFLIDNEGRPECSKTPLRDPSCFFPHFNGDQVLVNPINIIVILSDEHDQSVSDFGVPGEFPVDHSFSSYVASNDAQLKASSAALASLFKRKLDSFFLSLNQSASTDPLYSVMSIVNIQCNSSLDTRCGLLNGARDGNERWGVEYTSLVDALAGYPGDANRLPHAADTANSSAKYSQVYDINGSNYSSLFAFIGNRIADESKVIEVDEFQLYNRISTTAEMKVVLTLSSGQQITLPNEWLRTEDGFRLLIASRFQDLIPPDDVNASLTVYYTPRCYGQYC